MPWAKGQSGNPKGAPPKSRALTALLERAGSRTVEVDGKKVSGKRWLADALWQLTTTGTVTLPTGRVLVVEPKDWLETVKWLYVHIDGPAKQQTEHEGAITVHVVYDDSPKPALAAPNPGASNP
jgi:hypothetical protein